jgi:hypothetical protein
VEKNSQHKVHREGFIGYASVIAAAAFWGASGMFVKFIVDYEEFRPQRWPSGVISQHSSACSFWGWRGIQAKSGLSGRIGAM